MTYTAKEIADFLKSDTDLTSLKPAGLIAAYNGVAQFLGEAEVKKFADRKVAEKRVAAIVERGRARAAELAKAAKTAAKGSKATVAPKAKAEKAPTVRARVQTLVADGLDNDAIWAIVQKEFKMPDAKKYYVRWYRWDMNRKGV